MPFLAADDLARGIPRKGQRSQGDALIQLDAFADLRGSPITTPVA